LHQVTYALSYCPRTIALKAGRIVYDGRSDELTPALLCNIYGAESDEVFPPPLHQPAAWAARAGEIAPLPHAAPWERPAASHGGRAALGSPAGERLRA
jgi:phosphonate transport system ATP-binding protein